MARGMPGEEIYTPEVAPADLPRKTVPTASGISIGQNVEGLGDALQKQQVADSATYAGNQLAAFHLRVQQDQQDVQDSLQGDPSGYTPALMAKIAAREQELLDATKGNGVAQAMVRQSLEQSHYTYQSQALQYEAEQKRAFRTDSFNTALGTQAPLVRSNPDLKESITGTLLQQNDGMGGSPAERLARARAAVTTLSHNAALGLADKDPLGVYDELRPGGTVTTKYLQELTDPQSRADVLTHATAKSVDLFAQGIASSYRDGGPEAGQTAYGAIDKLPLDDDLKDKIRQATTQKLGEIRAEAQQTHADTIAALHREIASGNPSARVPDYVNTLYDANAIDAAAKGTLLGEYDRTLRARQPDPSVFGVGDVQAAYDRLDKLDPKNPDQKKALEQWFDEFTAANHADPGTPLFTNMAAEATRRLGMIPESALQWVRPTLTGETDPNKVAAAADAVVRLRNSAPWAWQYADDDKRLATMADRVTELMKGGMPAGQAVDIARGEAARVKPNAKLLEEQWNSNRSFGRSDSALLRALTEAIGEDPRFIADREHWWQGSHPDPTTIPVDMVAAFKANARARWENNGQDFEAARRNAAADIGRTWGVTMLNGFPEYSATPPERMFQDDKGHPILTHELVQRDLTDTLSQHPDAFTRWDPIAGKAVTFKPDPSRIVLTPNEKTAPSGGITYAMTYRDEHTDHAEAIIDPRTGKPLEYDLPVRSADYRKVRNALVSEHDDAEAASRSQANREAIETANREAALSSGARPVR